MEIKRTEQQMQEVTVECYDLCDKCGAKISNRCYDAFKFEFEYKTGSAYPDGGTGEKWILDLCANCAPKFIELLKEQGYSVQHKEWDY